MTCARPGCPGTLEDMGGGALYCDTCGLAPTAAPAPPPGAAPGFGPPGSDCPAPAPAPADPAAPAGGSRSQAPAGGSRSPVPHRSVPGRLSGGSSGGGPHAVSARSSHETGFTARADLGAGLVAVPPVPRADPRAAVLRTPEVPESRRWCSRSACGAAVGRSRPGRAGRTEGFCTRCGHPYSFTPKLRAGDVVHGQYEVVGCLAHGGLGWIYLAVDRAVNDRWVVLKGLLDTGDEDALAAAVAERRFLAEIEHAGIVRIYNFVEHLDPRTSTLDGYIVMEYVGGKSLKDIANERRDARGRRVPLPVEQALAYGIEALEALGHLHSRGLLYCDFKVDNALQLDASLKLIDLGAVRRMDDTASAIYGTVGYQAPEVAEAGPSVASDLYTVARTLAVLTFDFQGWTTVFADCLPDREDVGVFREYESFHRLLVRATDPDPRRRFSSAREMADQLTGVLREVVSLRTGQPRPAVSPLFGPEPRVVDTEVVAPLDGAFSRLGARRPRRAVPAPRRAAGTPLPRPVAAAPDPAACALALPVPLVEADDPNAAFLADLASAAPGEVLTALAAAPADSAERRLRELRARLELGDTDRAAGVLGRLQQEHPGDWRVVWYQGLLALTRGHADTAASAFDAVYDAFPGEQAPKLALAICAEALGRLDSAAGYYGLVWAVDRTWVSAAFGLARVRLAAGDRAGAVAALESVPEASRHFTAAALAAVRARLRARSPREPLLEDLVAASGRAEHLEALGLDPGRRAALRGEVFGCALDWVLSGANGAPAGPAARTVVLGRPVEERELRFGLEHSYRVLARLATSGEDRINLVDSANRFRPRTWV